MPITIQELLASDTISQAVDKINFNFDQLILNGGGPAGPVGPNGPTGPIGGRGIRGSKWFEDPNAAATDPNTLIFADIASGDYYLDADGQVWEYNGTIWVITTVDLTGPQGIPGASDGFQFFGGFPGGAAAGNDNVAYPTVMPGGIASGADQLTNEAVPSLLIAGIPQNAPATPGITYTNAFQISTAMMEDLDSSVVSTIIHQKDSAASAIKFMGGGAVASENFEQDDVTLLSEIKLIDDDALSINVVKPATSPTVVSNLIGFSLNTTRRGQSFRAGKQINIESGTDSIFSGVSTENSDVTITVNTSNAANPAKFSVASTAVGSSASFELGGNISAITTTTNTGRITGAADRIRFVAANTVDIRNGNNYVSVEPSKVEISVPGNDIYLLGNGGDIFVDAGTGGAIELNGNNTVIDATAVIAGLAPSIIFTAGDVLTLQGGVGSAHRITLDNTSVTTGGAKFQGNIVWRANNVSTNAGPTSHRSIFIQKEGSVTQSPVFIQAEDGSQSSFYGLVVSTSTIRGGSGGGAVNSTVIHNTGVVVDGNSANTGIEGFRLDAQDSISNRDFTQFWVRRNRTDIANRLVYIRKGLNINPATAGITGGSGGTGYTIPSTYMDSTYLDISLLSPLYVESSPVQSDKDWTLYIPDGTYEGQRLILHIVAAPCRTYDPSTATTYYWPPQSATTPAEVTIEIKSSAPGGSTTYTQVAKMEVGLATATPKNGSELILELLWSGRSYTTVHSNSGGYNIFTRRSGWLIMNGAGIYNTTGGRYEAVVNNETFS
jgi:hypothetical protein